MISRFIEQMACRESSPPKQCEQPRVRVLFIRLSDVDSSLATRDRRLFGHVAELTHLPLSSDKAIFDAEGRNCQTNRAEGPWAILDSVITTLQESDVVAVTLPANTDASLVRDALFKIRDSCRIVLQLSADQIQRPTECYELMQIARVTMLTEIEALALTGQLQLSRAIEELQRQRVGNVVVNRPKAVHALLDGSYYVLPTFPAHHVTRTVGANEALIATFALCMKQGRSWPQCLRSALQAQADFQEGLDTETISEATRSSLDRPDHPKSPTDSPVSSFWAATLLLSPVMTASVILIASVSN